MLIYGDNSLKLLGLSNVENICIQITAKSVYKDHLRKPVKVGFIWSLRYVLLTGSNYVNKELILVNFSGVSKQVTLL